MTARLLIRPPIETSEVSKALETSEVYRAGSR